MNRWEPRFDVFISYNRDDAAAVEALWLGLTREAGLKAWIDRARLQPGVSWRDEIEDALNASAAALIAWGPSGLGGTQRQERDLAYAVREARPGFRVLYALLPGADLPQGNWANVDTWICFDGGVEQPDTFMALVAAIKGVAPPDRLCANLPDEPAPYRGLATFDLAHAQFFYGRTAQVQEMLERLPKHPWLAVIGPSGTGKTSLAQAGLLARLASSPLRRQWSHVNARPGADPIRSLATEVARLDNTITTANDRLSAIDALADRLSRNPHELGGILAACLPSDGHVVIVLDKLEELFTVCESEPRRRLFIEAVTSLATHSRRVAWVVPTMRADFYGHLARYPILASQMVDHQLYLRPIADEDVRDVIERPAAQVGAIFEKGLAFAVADDARSRGEVVLPILEHALDLLWRHRRGRWLTWDAYKEIGGVDGALRYHADRVVESFDATDRVVAQRILTSLVRIDSSSMLLAGRRVPKSGLVHTRMADGSATVPQQERVLQRLADERLVLIADEEHGVELIHDTLPLQWQQLRTWVLADLEFILWRQRLESDVAEWQRTHGDEGTLLRGAPLAEGERWLNARGADLQVNETAFISESAARREQERSNAERGRRQVLATLTGGLVIALSLAVVATVAWRQADGERRTALARQVAAYAETVDRDQHDLRLLLAATAFVTADTLEARRTLTQALSAVAHLDRVFFPASTGAYISHAAFDPTGKSVVAALAGGSIVRWDVATGQLLGSMKIPPTEPIGDLTMSVDGRTLVVLTTVGYDKGVWLWDLSTANAAPRHIVPANRSVSVQLAPDASMMAVITSPDTITFWDLKARQQRGEIVHTNALPLKSATFSPDGRHFIGRTFANSAVLCNAAAAQPLCDRIELPDVPTSDAFDRSGNTLAIGLRDGRIQRFALTTHQAVGAPLKTGNQPVMAIAWEQNGTELVAVNEPGAVSRVDTLSGESKVLGSLPSPVHIATFTGNARRLVVHGASNSGVWDRVGLDTMRLRTELKVAFASQVKMSPNGRWLFIDASAGNPALRDLDATQETTLPLPRYAAAHNLVFSQDSQSLLISGGDRLSLWHLAGQPPFGWQIASDVGMYPRLDVAGTTLAWSATGGGVVGLWDLSSMRSAGELQTNAGSIAALALSRDARLLAAADDREVCVWNLQTRTRQRCLSAWAIRRIAFDRDARLLVVRESGGDLNVWDLASGSQHAISVATEAGSGLDLAISPIEPLVAVPGVEKGVGLLRIDRPDRRTVLKASDGRVYHVAFHPAGQLLAAGTSGTVQFFDVRSGAARDAPLPASFPVARLRFSDDGNILAVGYGSFGEGPVAVWQLNPRRLLLPAQLPPAPFGAALITADARWLVTAEGVQGVRLWTLDPKMWLERACHVANRNLTKAEWRQYVGDTDYRRTCSGLPEGQ